MNRVNRHRMAVLALVERRWESCNLAVSDFIQRDTLLVLGRFDSKFCMPSATNRTNSQECALLQNYGEFSLIYFWSMACCRIDRLLKDYSFLMDCKLIIRIFHKRCLLKKRNFQFYWSICLWLQKPLQHEKNSLIANLVSTNWRWGRRIGFYS